MGLGAERGDGLRFCPLPWLLLTLPGAPLPCGCPDSPCCPDSGRYNVGCTKRVGLFHSDRSKLQKAGATTHNRRRASKTSLPTLTKDTKKQVRRLAEPACSSFSRVLMTSRPDGSQTLRESVLHRGLISRRPDPASPLSLYRSLYLDLWMLNLLLSVTLSRLHPFLPVCLHP